MTITLVCGFPRCGSSLTMQMLHAAGMPTVGTWPDFEDDHALAQRETASPLDAGWLSTIDGHAMKLLDPQRFIIPMGDYRAIWLDRAPDQQALSQIKFMKAIFGLKLPARAAKELARSYGADKKPALRALAAGGITALLCIAFEDLIRRPTESAEKIATFCGLADGAAERMAAAVRPRAPTCARGMDMELALLASRA